MTHPPATCELCGDTGLYSPSALPCPKGCREFDLAQHLVEYVDNPHHINPMSEAFKELIRAASTALSEAEQREKDAKRIAVNAEAYGYGHGIEVAENREKAAREKALDDAAQAGYVACAETRHVTLGDKVAAAIRALKDEVR